MSQGLLGGLEVRLGLGDLGGQAVLLVLEQIEGDGAGVVGVEELLALAGERGEPPPLAGGLLLGLLADVCERLAELGAGRVDLLGGETDLGVGVLDGRSISSTGT